MSRTPATVPDETGTLSPRVLLRCSGCGLRWTAATLDPATCPACGRREGIALVRRFGAGRMSLQAGPPPALVESLPRSGTPTPDRERPPWHVTDVTPTSDAAPSEDPGGTVRPEHPHQDRPPSEDRHLPAKLPGCSFTPAHQCPDQDNKRQLPGHLDP